MTKLRLVLRAVAVVVGADLWGASAILATARWSATPVVLLGSGLLVAMLVAAGGIYWVTNAMGERSRAVRMWSSATIVLVVFLSGLSVAGPSPDVGKPDAAVPGQHFWQLPTGSRIRYVQVSAKGARRPEPVVFVHGGPGTPDMAGDAKYFGGLAEAGFEVYVYDEVGSGRSSRLPDPERYSSDRDVSDLEPGSEPPGDRRSADHSHLPLSRSYLAAHPKRVARTVLVSPRPLDPADPSPGGVRNRLGVVHSLRVYARVLRPRSLQVYALLQVNPEGAHALAGDAVMDAQNDPVYAASAPALHCAGKANPDPPTGLGFYRLYYHQSEAAPPEADLRRPWLAISRQPS